MSGLELAVRIIVPTAICFLSGVLVGLSEWRARRAERNAAGQRAIINKLFQELRSMADDLAAAQSENRLRHELASERSRHPQ